jgi:hypothetical protein
MHFYAHCNGLPPSTCCISISVGCFAFWRWFGCLWGLGMYGPERADGDIGFNMTFGNNAYSYFLLFLIVAGRIYT